MFNYDKKKNNFEYDPESKCQLKENVSLDLEGNIFKFLIELQVSKNIGHYEMESLIDSIYCKKKDGCLIIKMSKQIFLPSLLDIDNFFERVLLSSDCRIIMCGKVII